MNRWWMTPLLRRSIRQSLRRNLAGLWVRGAWPAGGAVLAPNHHSWWDAYLLGELAASQGQECRFLMSRRQLARFPFLKLVGAADRSALRSLVRSAGQGAWVVLFPEGDIKPQGAVHAAGPGAAWLAERAGVPLIPVALRVVMRGAQWPEAFVRFGAACAPDTLQDSLNAVIQALDDDLHSTHPDQPPAGYLRWVQGKASLHDEVDWPSRLLIRLGGFDQAAE